MKAPTSDTVAAVSPRLSPREALDAYHRRIDQERWDLRKTPDAVIEAERRDVRLRAEGWSADAIKHRANEAHPLAGAVEAYHETSLTPHPVEYASGASAVKKRQGKTSIRFPWWRSGPE